MVVPQELISLETACSTLLLWCWEGMFADTAHYVRNYPECATVSGCGRMMRPPPASYSSEQAIPDSWSRHHRAPQDHPREQECVGLSGFSYKMANDLSYP